MNLAETQRVFDTVAAHLLTQKKRAIRNQTCAYRDADGRKCAIGCLIKDTYYHRGLEDRLVIDSRVQRVVEKSLGVTLTGADLDLLEALQDTHDYVFPEEWEYALRSVAEEFELNWVLSK